MLPIHFIYHHKLKLAFLGLFISLSVTVAICQHSRTFEFGEYDRIVFNNPDFRLVFRDLRSDTSCLGFIVRNNFKNPIPILMPESIARSLQNIVMQGRTSKDVPILYFRILKLEIAEYETNGVDSRSELVADFVIETNDGYRIVHRKGLIVAQSGSRIMRKHRRNLIDLVQEVIDDLNEDDKLLESRVESNEISSLTDLGATDFEILKGVGRLEAGLYEDVFQFRSNKPAITDGYRIQWDPATTREKILVEIKSMEKGKTLSDIWGFCDGRNTFIKLGESYYLLEINKDRYSVDFSVDTKRINEDFIFYGGLLGGALGTLLGALIAEETADWGIARFSVDLSTGEITSDLDPVIITPGFLTILRNTSLDSTEEVKVLVDDLEIGTFTEPRAKIERLEIQQLTGSVITIRRGIQEYMLAIDKNENLGSEHMVFFVEERKNRIRLRKLTNDQAKYHLAMIKRYELGKMN